LRIGQPARPRSIRVIANIVETKEAGARWLSPQEVEWMYRLPPS